MRMKRLWVFATMAALILTLGCSQSGPRRTFPKLSLNAEEISAKALEQYDADKDGKISGAELDKCPALKQVLSNIDKNGDKSISGEELAARVQEWQARQSRIGFDCVVSHNGKPLQGADVKFVPEAFMGDGTPAASGKTAADGSATMISPGEMGGVPPGLYRIEVTKEGENIPATYNTATTLGTEVVFTSSRGAPAFKILLKY